MPERKPFNIAFLITSMPIGGAETLLVNLLRSIPKNQGNPTVICLKEKGPLGQQIQDEFPVYSDLIKHKLDIGILFRLRRIFKERQIDAIVTVGAGDKMFWGRLAAYLNGTPVILSALHSTGWPDGVGKLNRLLTPITDGFIAVAKSHGDFLRDFEKFPDSKVFVVNNGIDTDRFRKDTQARRNLRKEWGFSDQHSVCGVVAALRPEKNLRLFLDSAKLTNQKNPQARFVITGSGPEEGPLKDYAKQIGVDKIVQFLGSRSDIPQVLSGFDLFALTSDNEASPVSILEAMSCELPVVCTDVGSVRESVEHGKTGFITPVNQAKPMAEHWNTLLSNSVLANQFGAKAREQVVENNSLKSMTDGYLKLIRKIYSSKLNRETNPATSPSPSPTK